MLGAKKNVLKITEKPVFYSDRIHGETKMKNVLVNGARMFYIIIYSFFQFKKDKLSQKNAYNDHIDAVMLAVMIKTYVSNGDFIIFSKVDT